MSETRKWQVVGRGAIYVCTQSKSVIARCHNREHADLIVKAVNSRDALLEACKAALPLLEDAQASGASSGLQASVIAQMRAAIAAAE